MPEQPQISWADRIASAKKNTFKPLDFNVRYNFTIDSTEVKNSAKVGDFIVMKCSVLDGDRKNFKSNINTMPEQENPWRFLQLFEAVGFNQEWLLTADPSVQVIADNLVGRQFSVEVVQGNSQRDDGTYWPEYQKFLPVVASTNGAPAQGQDQVVSGFGNAPAPTQANAPAQAPQAPQVNQNFGNSGQDGSPWGTPNEAQNNNNSGDGMVSPF